MITAYSNWPSAGSRVFTEMLTAIRTVPLLCGTRSFVTACTRSGHLSISWARSIQSAPFQPISSRSLLILHPRLHQGRPPGIFPSGFASSTLYAFIAFPVRAAWLCVFQEWNVWDDPQVTWLLYLYFIVVFPLLKFLPSFHSTCSCEAKFLRALFLKIQVFWDVTPCRLVKSYRRREESCWLRNVGNCWPLKTT
jgi:hypothetical protein